MPAERTRPEAQPTLGSRDIVIDHLRRVRAADGLEAQRARSARRKPSACTLSSDAAQRL